MVQLSVYGRYLMSEAGAELGLQEERGIGEVAREGRGEGVEGRILKSAFAFSRSNY